MLESDVSRGVPSVNQKLRCAEKKTSEKKHPLRPAQKKKTNITAGWEGMLGFCFFLGR